MKEIDPVTYWVALHSIRGLGPVTYRRLLDRFGEPRGILLETTKSDLNSLPWLRHELAKDIFQVRRTMGRFASIVDTLAYNGVRILTLADRAFPPKIRMLKHAPVVLYFRGEYLERDKRALAIVGSTRPSMKGYRIAAETARRLAQKGFTIISGYARGIDTAAHSGAMKSGRGVRDGRTIMVIPAGLDHFVWKKTLGSYADRKASYSVISESFPDQKWSVGSALSRNRLIAALSDAVFVVETDVGGGAIHTFSHAKTLGKKTFVLKYTNPPKSAMGNQSILSQGAIPVSNYADIENIAAYL